MRREESLRAELMKTGGMPILDADWITGPLGPKSFSVGEANPSHSLGVAAETEADGILASFGVTHDVEPGYTVVPADWRLKLTAGSQLQQDYLAIARRTGLVVPIFCLDVMDHGVTPVSPDPAIQELALARTSEAVQAASTMRGIGSEDGSTDPAIRLAFFGGATASQAERDAVAYAWSKGTIPVASAGNDAVSTQTFPAGITNVVSVAATDANDAKASFSNFGSWVKIAAPGDKIYSTLPGGRYGPMSGTSMAAPMMAGVLGLIWSTSYGTSADAVVKRACDTSDKIGGTGTNWQCGRVNAFAAVQGGGAPAPSTGVVTPSGEPGTGAITPSFYPLAPCPTCTTQSGPSIAPETPSGTMVNPSSSVEYPQVSGTPQLPKIGRGHAGQQGGLISIILAFIILILEFFARLIGR